MIDLTRKTAGIGLAALAMLGAAAAHGQQAASPQDAPALPPQADAFNIPASIKIFGTNELGSRKATAIVNGTLVTGTDVDQRTALLVAASGNGPPTPDELQRLRLQVLRNIIDETLQIQEAKAREHDVAKEQIDETYAKLAAEKFNMSVPDLDKFLLAAGSSPQSLRRQIEGELAWDWLMRNFVAPFVQVSDNEVNELHQRLEASRGSNEYRVGEIFLSATPATREAVAQNGQRIVEQIRQGASFVGYARQFSEASTAAVGGDLGWIKLEQLQNPQLESVAAQMQPGQLVGPVEIPGGFSILYMIDKRQVGMADPRDAQLSLKQISLDFAPGTPEAEARVKAESFAAAVQQIRGCGEAEEHAAKLGAAVVGNDSMRVRDLPDALQNMVLQLSVGQATQVYGTLTEGVRVLMLCGRDDPQGEGGVSTSQLMAQLENDRVQKRAERYLRDLRRDAVIEYN